MHAGLELTAVRQAIMDLRRQQMKALDSPEGLTEDQLRECYERQTRVQELREQLQAASNSQVDASSIPETAQPIPVSAETTADHCAS